MDDDMNAASQGAYKYCQMFEEAENMTADSRLQMDTDKDFYDGNQLTAKQRAELRRRKQPDIVINLIKPEIDYLAGMEKSQRVDPKCYPRNPQDEQAAYVATQALRYVVDDQRYDRTRSFAWKQLLITGLAVIDVRAERGRNGIDPKVKAHSYDRFFYDPYSMEADFSDARYMGYVNWMDEETGVAFYGEEFRDILTTTLATASYTNHYDDKPKYQWGDKSRKRVRVVEMYCKEAEGWKEVIFTKGGVISEQASPYLDEDGRPECPIYAQSAYIDRDNNRYGQIREMRDPQSDFNKRRQKATHILNSRQVIADKGAVADANKARRDLARPDAWIEKNPGKEIDINANTGLEMGQFQLMQSAESQLRSNSLKNAMIGGDSQSGRSKQAQQQAAMVEIGDLLDALRDLDIRVFRGMWNRIKQFWQEPRYVRVTDNPDAPSYLGVNVPLTDPMGNVMQMQNPVAEMDVDLRIEEAPDVTSLQAEDFERFTTILPTLIQAPPQWASLVVELMPHTPGKERAKQILEQMAQPQSNPMQEEAAMLELNEKAATIDKIQSETVKNQAQAQAAMQPNVVPIQGYQ